MSAIAIALSATINPHPWVDYQPARIRRTHTDPFDD